jgi:predicted amidohydrolase
LIGCGSDQDANREKGEAFCRSAREMGADIALLPELWNIGGLFPSLDAHEQLEWQSRAITEQDEFVVRFRGLASELGMAIALTYLQRWKPAPRNSVSLIDSHGDVVLTYSKVHTCDYGADAACEPGDDFCVCTLDTKKGEVKIGAMICYDREFPESARILMLKGAELILTPNACELDDHRIAQFRTRAFENMVGVAMANYPEPQNNGRSAAFSPVCVDADGRSMDNLIVEADVSEGIYLAEFDLDAMRAYREREVWGAAYRKTRTYGPLTFAEVRPPFVRRDAKP